MSLIILFTLILAFLKLTKRFVVLFNHCQGSPLRAIFVTLKDYVPIKCAHVEVLHVFSTLFPPQIFSLKTVNPSWRILEALRPTLLRPLFQGKKVIKPLPSFLSPPNPIIHNQINQWYTVLINQDCNAEISPPPLPLLFNATGVVPTG